MACTLVQRQRLPQAHVRSGHIVEGLEEDHPLPQALAVFTEAGRLTDQRCQGVTHGQVHPFDQGRADREAQVRQAFGPKHDARAERQQLALGSIRSFLRFSETLLVARKYLIEGPVILGAAQG